MTTEEMYKEIAEDEKLKSHYLKTRVKEHKRCRITTFRNKKQVKSLKSSSPFLVEKSS